MTNLHPELARILLSEEAIQRRVKEMAVQIAHDYADVESLYMVGILKGAFMFMADLARVLSVPHTVDFMAVSSYGRRGAVAGEVRFILDLREPITDKHVLIVEDIVDSGDTLRYLRHALQGRGPASLRTCAFVRKPRDNQDVQIDYLGFDIPDAWVVGYGLDYAERHRTLAYVAELKPETYQ